MLADKLYELTSFKRQFDALIIVSVSDAVRNLKWDHNRSKLLGAIDWNNLISIASVLSFSENYLHLDAALRIAQSGLVIDETKTFQKDACAVVLQNLTNSPSINLAKSRNILSEDYFDKLNFSLKLKSLQKDFENTILIKDNSIKLNIFQKLVYDKHKDSRILSISAPTSAGKSFILCNLIIEELIEGPKNIVYVVPTRALISQVENDLRKLFIKYAIKDAEISTVPQKSAPGSNVYVFTQERLHWHLMENQQKLDLIVVDEAHKIEDGYRGILLQQKIEEVISKNQEIRVIFSSPFTSNPEVLLENIDSDGLKDSINTQFVSVNQNLLYVNQVRGVPTEWAVSLCTESKTVRLGTIELASRPSTEGKKMAFISSSMTEGGNIIYCNGAAEAEEIALLLNDYLTEEVESEEINDLITLSFKTIHSKYRLNTVLNKGIAFHYGNMPLLVREEIERLFNKGEIKYLVCTSTLLEGINLPAKSIFIRKPRRGSKTPLNESDFWNLAGRAGRWGKEFSGNIICIEPDKWTIQPNPKKKKQEINRAIDLIKSNSSAELFEFIRSGSPRSEAEKRQDLEFAFGYFFSKYLDKKLPQNDAFFDELNEILKDVETRIDLPKTLIKRNPGISPFAQQDLFSYFQKNSEVIESLIPVYPEDDGAYPEYEKLISTIGTTISFYPPILNKSRAILIMNWMRGKPLSYLISSSFKSYESSGKNKSLHTVIREVMENVESFARFRFAKDSSCYIDILRHYLVISGKEPLLKRIPDIPLWLEFGVSQKTQLSLLNLGLSRNTAIELTQFITDTEMDKDQLLSWFEKNDIGQFNLSPIMMQEIKQKIFTKE